MKPATEPINYLWWLVSRASGIVALSLISLSVMMGLAMAAKVIRRPRLRRSVARLHEHVALTALGAIALHGLSLLGDQWLKPGWAGIAIPFVLSYRPAFTGAGIIAGYLALALGPSFYLRRRIGGRRWRKLHTAIALAWVISAVHALGSGSDAPQLWLQGVVVVPGAVIVYLLVLRVLKAANAGRVPARDVPETSARRTAARQPVRVMGG